MVQLDIESIVAVNPLELSAQEKDDLFESIPWIDTKHVPPDKYEPLFNITKEIMKYKGEQVESLLADLDILANSSAGGGNEALQEEVTKAKKQIAELLEETQAKDKDLEAERLQVEKLLSEIADLQKEKAELRKEIVMIQNESQAGAGASLGEESSDDSAQLKEMIQHKNKHILQLLSDIQVLEKENEIVNNKLNSIRQELSEATTNLTKLSGENISLRQSNYEFKEKIATLEGRNAGLTSQVAELIEERSRREAHLDVLIDALEERVTKWQEILSEKDEEVTELRAKLNEAVETSATKGSMMFTANYLELTKTIEEQEEAIKNLHEQLKQATEDMSNCSIQVQELKQKAEAKDTSENGSKSIEEMKEELEKAQSQIHFLQDKVNDAEQDAQFRAEEMAELIIQLKEYEEGVYGLSEARSQVKDLKRQLKTRDNQILKLIEQINILNLEAGGGKQIDLENFEKYFEEEEKTSSLDLQTQLSAVQQTAINLSMQNFELRAQVVKLNEDSKKREDQKEPALDIKEKIETEEKLKVAIEENESLRKGLHEILESIQGQDGSSTVVIESECLERLLEALDARHVSGWYHPAMRLQAALNKMQGNNDALRQELRESRFRESYFQAELQSAMIQVGELQDQLKKFYVAEHPSPPVPAPRLQVLSSNEEEGAEKEVGEAATVCAEKQGDEVNGGSYVEISEPRISEIIDQATQTEITLRSDAIVQTDLLMAEIDHFQMLNSQKPQVVDKDLSPVPLSDNAENDNKEKLKEDLSPTKNDVRTGDDRKDLGTGDAATTATKSVGTCTTDSVTEDKTRVDEVQSPTKTKMDEIERDLRKKCDELKTEFENIKKINEMAVEELQKNKQELFSEVQKALLQVNEEMKSIKETEIAKPVVNEFTLGAFKEQEAKLLSYGIELGEVRRSLAEKEVYVSSLESKIKELNSKIEENNIKQREQDGKRVKALKETISSLEQIVKQKEASCQRYKALLQESSEEYGQLLEKYHVLEKNLHTVPTPRDPLAESRSVSILMEKWIARVHGLEAEIDDLTHKLYESNHKLEISKKECEHWQSVADSFKEASVGEEELKRNKKEIDELRLHLKELKDEAEIGFQNKLQSEVAKFKEKEDDYKHQLKIFENENTRLKHQLNIRSAKSTTKSVKKEIVLQERIKALEDEIEKCRERERSQLQMRREKCTDEVAKWEERKRLQTTNEKYKQELKEKGNQIEQLEGQISRLKVIIARMERERISLQRRLKISDGLLVKSLSEEEKTNELDDNKSYATDSRFETPVLDSTPRSPAESLASELHDPKIKTQSRRDLVRAIAALKKVIQKLRAEHSNYYHKDYVEQLQNELRKMENNYMDAVERALSLEEQIRDTEAKLCGQTYIVGSNDERSETVFLKEQLAQKCELLCKVKVLLQRAILREKQLIQQVTLLEKLVPPEKLARFHEEAREM